MEFGKLPEPEANARPGTRSFPLEIDLNETPLSSPREVVAAEAAESAANDGGSSGEVVVCCGKSTSKVDGDVLACCGCGRGFHTKCLGIKEDQKCREWKCFRCLLSNGSDKLQGRVGLLDINASPPREADGEGSSGEFQSSGHATRARNAEHNNDKMHSVGDIPNIGHARNGPATISNMLNLENGFNLLKASYGVRQIPKSGLEEIVHHRLDRAPKEVDLSSTFEGELWPGHCTPLNFLPQSQSEVYLQALREYVHEKQGLLVDGWKVEFVYCVTRCKTFPIYCAPDGKRFESMSAVAEHLGLLTNCHSLETEVRSDRFTPLQNGLVPNWRQKEASTLSRGDNCKENQNTPSSSPAKDISSIREIMNNEIGKHGSSRGCNESDSSRYGRCGFELFQDGFPLQFEDLFVISLGKVDPRPSYHNTCHIWPVGYKSCWHDKITGSIFVSEVVDGGDTGPIFKVQRYPCSSIPIPTGSTVIIRQTSDSYNGRNKVPFNYSTTSMDVGDDSSIQMMLIEDRPPQLEDIDSDKTDSSKTEFTGFSQRFVNSAPDVPGLGDCVGGFLVEARSSSLAWEGASQTLVRACHEVYKQIGILHFFCKHYVNGVNNKEVDDIDSLSKFCCVSGPTDIPHSIQSNNEFDTSSEMLMKWLRDDRFGLDLEFVQEMIEQLPGVHACLEYKFLNKRRENSGSRTVRSGFLLAKRKSNVDNGQGEDGLFINCKRPRKQSGEDSEVRRSFPLGKPVSIKLPASSMGDVLQAWEFLCRFSEVLGLEEPKSFEELENELMNPWSVTTIPLEGTQNEIQICDDVALCTGAALTKAHSSLLKVVVGELLLKVVGFIDPNFDSGECKSRRGRKKDADNSLKKMKFDMLQINGLTWPELARRYILVVLSLDGNIDSAEITCRESGKIFHCLQGDGGILCGSLTGVAGMEADALLLAEASKQVFGSLRKNEFVGMDQLETGAMSLPKTIKVNDTEVPEWVTALEPVKKLPTNVGARIRKCVHDALEKNPPDWAKKILEHSISKEVYKGNASGPTKRAIVSLLSDVSSKNSQPKLDKKEKVKRVCSVSDLIMKQCHIVLRRTVAEDEEKVFCNLLGRTLLNPSDNDDEGLLGYPAMVSRPLDFRTIDVRLAIGAYGGSHKAFLEDVREVLNNIRMAYADQSELIDLAETLSQKFEAMYEKEVLSLVQFTDNASLCTSDEAKKEMDDMLVHANENSLPKAPWDEGVCKVCGVDKDDDNVLLCDTCDSEYHTYCLSPPLARIPEGNWYCPSCVASQHKSQSPIHGTRINWCRKKRYRGEFTQNFMDALSQLARTMGSKEYWEFSVEERILLIKFLCDETLNSSIIRDHLDHCANLSSDLQQKLRFLSSEWKNLKLREEILVANSEKLNVVHNTVGELASDTMACVLTQDGKLMGQPPTQSNNISCFSGNFSQLENGPLGKGPNDYNRNQICRVSDTVLYEPIKDLNLLPENHFSLTNSVSKEANWQDEIPSSIPPQQNSHAMGGNSWSHHSAQQRSKNNSNNGSLLTPCQVPHGFVSLESIKTTAEHVSLVHVNTKDVPQGHNSSVQSDTQADNPELNSLKHEISGVQDSFARLEYELQKVSVRKEFLGRDSAGRMYWVFGGPDTCPLLVNQNLEVKQSKEMKNGAPIENNPRLGGFMQYCMGNLSSSRVMNVSSGNEYALSNSVATCVWSSYLSDAEIGELIGWLGDGDARDRELKESILNWQRNILKDMKNAENYVQNEKQSSCLNPSSGAKASVSTFLMTKALTALEKKHGPCTGSETIDISKKRGQKGKFTCERMYRCECLEPIWPSRHHCVSCHQTCDTGQELERHNDGMCSADSSIPKTNKVNEDSQKGKRMSSDKSSKKRPDVSGIGKSSKNEKSETGSNKTRYQEPECPFVFEEICAKFVPPNSLKELVKDIGLIGSSGTPSFLPSVSPYLSDPTLRLDPAKKDEASTENESTDLESELQGSIRRISMKGATNCDNKINDLARCVGNVGDEDTSQVERLISNSTNHRSQFPSTKNKSPAHGMGIRCTIPESSLRRLVGRASQILRQLKINLLDMDAALPEEALRPSLGQMEKRSAWRAFVKSSGSIYEMVQATVVLENMIKADYLKKDWWYWSSLSAAANISTLSALALRLYTLDASIIFEKPLVPSDSAEILKPGFEADEASPSTLDTSNSRKTSSPQIQKTHNNPTDLSKPKSRQNKRRKDSGG